MAAKTNHRDDFRAWVEYFETKWSRFFEAKTDPFSRTKYAKADPLDLKTSKGKKRTNHFFTVCGFPPSARREAKNANAFFVFYFDIDMKENPDETKATVLDELRNLWGVFDFVVETKNGFHLYILVPQGTYAPEDGDVFKKDWKLKREWLSNATGLKFDEVFDLARISRIPWSVHLKKCDGDGKPFRTSLLKGRELLYSNKGKKMLAIDAVPIGEVLYRLGIRHSEDGSIYRNGMKTDGWKVNMEENYVNDFSHNNRPIWGPFAFVKTRFYRLELERNPKLDPEIAANYARGNAHNFFSEHFGILPAGKKGKTIPVPSELEEALSNPATKWKDAKITLGFFKYARDKFNNEVPYGKRLECPLSTLAANAGIADGPGELAKYMPDYLGRLPRMKKAGPAVRFELSKKSKEWTVSFVLMPSSVAKGPVRAPYGRHYVNAKCLSLPSNGKAVPFYLFLCSKLLNVKKRVDFDVKKDDVKRYFQETNYRRIRRTMRKIADTTDDFAFGSVKYGVSFSKGKRKPSKAPAD